MAIGDNARLGYDSAFAVGEEPTWGTRAVTATMKFFEFIPGSDIKQDIEKVRLDHINTNRNYTKLVQTNETVEGTLEFNLNTSEDAQMLILKQAMGGTVTSASTGSYIAHTFLEGNMEDNNSSVSAADVKGLSAWKKSGATKSSAWIFTGGRVNTLTFRGELGSPVVASAEMIFQTGSVSADTQAISYDTQLPAMFHGISIKQGATTTALTEEKFQSFELVINNNLQNDDKARQLGNKQIGVLPPGKREVNLTLTQRHDTTTAYTRFFDNTANTIRINMDTGVTIGATGGATTYSMYIDLFKVYFNDGQPESADNGILSQNIPGMCIADSQTGKTLEAVAFNAAVGY